MTRRTVARGLLVAALAALCGTAGNSGGQVTVALPPLPAVPAVPVAVLTARPQAMLSKLGMSPGDVPVLRHFKAKVGVPLE